MAEVGVGLGYDMIKKITVNILSNDANNIIYSEGWWLIGGRSCEGGGSWCCSSGKNWGESLGEKFWIVGLYSDDFFFFNLYICRR